MKFENTDIILIVIYRKKDSENQATFSQLENFLNQEKSQISHDLKKLEAKKLMEKMKRLLSGTSLLNAIIIDLLWRISM